MVISMSWTRRFSNVVSSALTTVGALMTLIDFNLSNARRFYSSMGNPLAVKGLDLFAVAIYDLLMFYLCKHILMCAHLLFLFSLRFSNHNDAISDNINKNETTNARYNNSLTLYGRMFC